MTEHSNRFSDKTDIDPAGQDLLQSSHAHALIELLGPSRAQLACTVEAGCRQPSEHVTGGKDLADDLKLLRALDDGNVGGGLKSDLALLNRKLEVQQSPFRIENIDWHHGRVLLSAPNGRNLQLVDEDGLKTIAYPTKPLDKIYRFRDAEQAMRSVAQSMQSIKPQDINQKNIPDCYFQGTVSSVAASAPDSLRNMIHLNIDRSFTVTFPGDRTHPQTIKAPNAAELDWFSGGKSAKWSDVLEKAHRKLTGKSLFDSSGRQLEVMELLTGRTAKELFFNKLSETQSSRQVTDYIADTLTMAGQQHAPVAFGTFKDSEKHFAPNGLQPSHTYSMIKYDARTQIVTLRNPIGSGDTHDSRYAGYHAGEFQMPLSDVVKKFKFLTTLETAVPKAQS